MIPTPVQSGLRRDVHEHVTQRCRFCGKLPVRLDETDFGHHKLFLFVCPNEDCVDGIHAAATRPQKNTKEKAAEAWNEANQP